MLGHTDLSDDAKAEIAAKVEKMKDEEINNHPRIALIGKTGVGKSSTINSLFNASLPVSHFKACTQNEEEITIECEKGKIIVYDMPGLGEDIDKDEIHKVTYKKVLPKCDVIIWILKADTRDMAEDQRILRDVLNEFVDKLVIGVNQIDKVHPDNWIEIANIPSEAQEKIIDARIIDIQEKMVKVVPHLSKERILFYSALKKYRLEQLFSALMDACGNRGWVLHTRKSTADYTKTIDKKFLN